MARPTSLTPELASNIVKLIQLGAHPVTAAGAYGVARSTFYDWVQRGEMTGSDLPIDPLFIDFSDNVRKAEYEAESTLVGLAIAKIKTTSDAVMLLERRFSERWQRREEVTINLRREAEKIAKETGLNADEILSEVESILAGVK